MRSLIFLLFIVQAPQALAHTRPLREAFSNLNAAASPTPAPEGFTSYLHLAGVAPQDTNDDLFAALNERFPQFLLAHRTSLRFSYVLLVYGQSHFNLNVIVEPMGKDNLDEFTAALAEMANQGFKDYPVTFQAVEKIVEATHFLAGTYQEGDEDSLKVNFDIARDFPLPTLAAFVDFTNDYGYALLNRDNAAFRNYFRETFFAADTPTYQQIEDTILPHNNVVAIDPAPYLILTDHSVIDATWETTPFIPYRFMRNCWHEDYEAGMCYPH